MNLDNLQKGFFGYKKSSVYEYISSMEEEFSERLLEKDEDTKKKEEEYKEKIRQLEVWEMESAYRFEERLEGSTEHE